MKTQTLLKSVRNLTTLSLVAAFAMLLNGCSSMGKPKSQGAETAKSLNAVAELLDEAQTKSVGIKNTLYLISEPTTLQEHYKAFLAQLEPLEKTSRKLESSTASLKETSTEYFAKWQQQISGISNPKLRTASTERLTEVSDSVTSANLEYGKVKTALDNAIQNLNDIKIALKSDLTPDGVAGVKKFLKDASSETVSLESQLSALSQKYKAAASALQSNVPPGL